MELVYGGSELLHGDQTRVDLDVSVVSLFIRHRRISQRFCRELSGLAVRSNEKIILPKTGPDTMRHPERGLV